MNIYSFQNRFILDIASTDYIIREPVGWDTVKAEMSRDFGKYRYGFTDLLIQEDAKVAFTQDPSSAGNRSFNLLKDLFNAEGTDAQAIFRFEAELDPLGSPGVFTIIYTANVDFDPKKFEIVDRQVKATLKTISFEDKFNSRLKTLVDIKSNIDLDGNAGTTFSPANIKLHSKSIRKTSRGITGLDVTPDAPNTLIFSEDLNEIEYEDGSRGFITSGNLPSSNDPTPPGTRTFFYGGSIFASSESRAYELSINIDSEIFTQDKSFPLPFAQVASMYLVDVVNAITTRTLVATSLPFPSFGQEWFVDQTISLIKLSEDIDATSYSIEIDIAPTNGAGNAFLLLANDFKFSITIDTLKPESLVDMWALDQVGGRLVEATTGVNAYQSDILNTGCATDVFFTNGRFIKGQTGAEFNPKTSAKIFIESMGGMFNMGYGFEGSTIRHEEMDHFFQDVEILQINNTDLEEYSETAFDDLLFNEIKTGYKKGFDKELFVVDDPQGEHEYLLPLISPKGVKDFRGNYIASMYAIEDKRREQFLKENKSNKFDDDGFLIKANRITEYDLLGDAYFYRPNEIEFNGEFYDIDNGESITLVGGPQAGVYTVGLVVKEGGATFIKNLVPAIVITGVFIGPASIQFGVTKVVPERDERFASVTDMISPETAYNLHLTPKRLLLNMSSWINSVLNFKAGAALIRNTFVKNNGLLTTQLNNGVVSCNDPDTDSYQENANIAIQDINNGAKLFTGIILNIKAEIGNDNIDLIMDANKNQLTGGQAGLNRGYITANTPDGLKSGWVYEMAFGLNKEVVEMTVLEKA